ncbi:hypothetical protein BDR26DRAFT_476139 [Obelidium mucronatum]|nr:hypothetical protein BDR26DRAFT_476139 [Obelidium mucronatum]
MELAKQQCASLEMQLKMVADELSVKEQELERVRSAAGDSNSAIAEVNESRRLLEVHIGELTQRISEKEDQAKAMERLWADCKEKLSVAESNLAVSEDTAAEAQDELSEVKEKAKELKSRLSAAILELNGRDEELSQLKQKKLDLEEQISALLAKASGDESLQCRALSDAHDRIQILTTELAEMTTLHSSELQERIKYFDEEKLNLNQELKRAEDELSALRAENEKAIGECRSRLNSQVDDLNTRLGVALGLSADLEKQCSILVCFPSIICLETTQYLVRRRH